MDRRGDAFGALHVGGQPELHMPGFTIMKYRMAMVRIPAVMPRARDLAAGRG